MFQVEVDGYLTKDVEYVEIGKKKSPAIKGRIGINDVSGRNDDDEPIYSSTFKSFTYFTQFAEALSDNWLKGKKVCLTGDMRLFTTTNDNDEEVTVETINVRNGFLVEKIEKDDDRPKKKSSKTKSKGKKRSKPSDDADEFEDDED